MTQIRVIPEQLLDKSQNMAGSSGQIRQAADLGHVLQWLDRNAYEGQLYSQVAARVGRAQSAAAGPTSRLSELATDLATRARKFLAADLAAISGFSDIGNQFNGMGKSLSHFPNVPNLPLDQSTSPISGSSAQLKGPNTNYQTPFSPPTQPLTPKPKPPAVPLVPGIDPRNYSSTDGCVRYAQTRRPDLGTAPGDGGAANYIDKFKSTEFQIKDEHTDLTTIIASGYAIVWPVGLLSGPGATDGHVAIVEEVDPDYIIVSQAGWGNTSSMKLTIEQLKSLYIIP